MFIRGNIRFLNEDYYDDQDDDYYIDDYYNDSHQNNVINQEMSLNSNSLESLLSIQQISDLGDVNQEIRRKKYTLNDYFQRNMNDLKEDLVYYFSSPDSVIHYKNNSEEEIRYDFYKDLDNENFISAQLERFKRILSISKSNSDSQMKKSKLSDFNNNFCLKSSLIKDNAEIHKKIINANLIGIKMDEALFKYSNQNTEENSLITYLKELKDILTNNIIDMESLGLVHYGFIEKNLIFILRTIENRLFIKKDKTKLTDFCQICLELFNRFNSIKLYFYIIQYLTQYKDLLNFSQLNMIKDTIQFIPNNCFDFITLERNISKILINDLRKPLIDQGITKKSLDEIQLNLNDYISLNYDDYLLLFIGSQGDSKEFSKNDFYFYYKIDLTNTNTIDVGKIILFNEEDKKNDKIVILDINISIKKEFIYIFYIVENSSKFFLKCKLYNKYSMILEKEKKIELKNSFIPKCLFNDNKYLYCISYKNEIFMVKRNPKLDNEKYINCSFRLFENDLLYYTEINDLAPYEMFNSLYINNIFFLNNVDINKIYLAKLIIDKNCNYILNIYDMGEKAQNLNNIKITYNDGRFATTKIYTESNRILYNITSNDFNDLIDKGISLLPFNTKISNYNYPDDIYEYLIQEYSSFLNLCGNFELINEEKEKNLIKYPFSLCCNFDQNFLDFIMDKISENNGDYNIKMNYIIILKQIICSLYNTKILKEEAIIIKIIPYFKKLILNLIESKETKLLNKILSEIIEISSYIKNNTIIEIDEIKFALHKDYNNINIKSKFLLIELLLKQNKMKNPKELYEYIVNIEKNYLIDTLNSENFDLSKYHYCKNLMINVSESFFKNVKIIQNDLISLIPCLLDNIHILFELYKNKINQENNLLEKYYFLYNSFIFRSFFFLIEYLIANKIILTKKEYITSIYKMILKLDKNNINSNLFFDTNNIIEISNYTLNTDERGRNFLNVYHGNKYIINIKLKEIKDIIFKTNLLNIKDYRDLYNSIKITVKTNKDNYNGNKLVSLFQDKDNIYHDVSEINIEFKPKDRNLINDDFIINIIPIKNEKMFKSYKANKDYKIISLIEKSIIYYLLFLFEDIKTQIEKYNNDNIIKAERKIFQSEIFKFLSIPKNEFKQNNFISTSKFNILTNKVLEKLNETMDNIEDLDILNNELNTNFNKINKELNQNIFNIQKNLDEKIKQISSIKGKNIINLFNTENIDKIIQIFNYDLLNKSNIPMQMNKNDELNNVINKIFLFGIKYYNCFEILKSMMKNLEKYKINNIEDFKNNIEQIRKIDNYSLFYSFYEESFKIKSVYHEHKKYFNDSNYDEENKNFFNKILEKIDFLNNNIIPNDDFTIKPNVSIIKNLIEIIDNSNLEINDIIQYFRLQNINSQISIIELNIINNLLFNLTNEENIKLILNIICRKMRQSHNILSSIFDNTYGVDYFNMEKLKQEFHLFLNILSNKIINEQNNYSFNTKISLTENLIWKIKKRDFHIILEIMKIFEDIKQEKKKNNSEYLFNFSVSNIYNVNYFNEKKNVDCKFEVFKILVYQIINIIKDILKFKKVSEKDLSLERNISKISENDFEKIFEKIISYFVEITPECIYYDDLILFFYKMFINSEILLKFIFQTFPDVIMKIINISFDKNININTRLIMIKLLCQIIENIKEDNLDDLSLILQNNNNKNVIIKNPIIYLYEYIIKELNDDSESLGLIIKKYFTNLLLVILNKMLELKANENDKNIQNIINNKFILNLFLFDDNFIYVSENKFFIQPKNSNELKISTLFNSLNNKSIKAGKSGKIICFLGDKFNFNFNNVHNNTYFININNSRNIINTFDKSAYFYSSTNIDNKCKNVLVIMNDFEQLDFYDISNVEIKEISNLEIINSENVYKKIFFRNNSNLLIKAIKEELNNDNLNEKGIYLVLKLLSKLIKYMNKDDLISILEIFWKFYSKNKSEENNYPFMSLEYIEKNINKYFQFNKIKTIYKEKEENNDSIYSLFDFQIKDNIFKDNILEINRDLEYINKNLKIDLFEPIEITDSDIEKIYNEIYKLSSLSFIISDENFDYKTINSNSILFIKSINDISDISKIIEENANKIKVIITNELNDNMNINDLTNFIKDNKIPIYKIEKSIFKKLTDFFTKGNAAKYKYLYKGDINSNINEDNNSNNLFHIYKIKFDQKEVQEINPIEELIKKMPKSKFNKIKDNELFKTKICKNYYKDGTCPYQDRCIYAHGNDEKLEVKKIREYLKTKNEQQEKSVKYDIFRNKLFKELKEESKNLFDILNIKLSKRLIFDILYQDCIKLNKMNLNIKDISYIFEVLCLEFYFNVANKISNEILREKLLNYFNKLINENDNINIEWIQYLFDAIEKSNYNMTKTQDHYLSEFKITNLNNEKSLLEKSIIYTNIIYDKLLYLLEIIDKNGKNEYFIKYYFSIINLVLHNITKNNNIQIRNYSRVEYEDSLENLLLLKTINILYDYFSNKIINNQNENEIIENITNIPESIDEEVKKLISINLDDYLQNNNSSRHDFYIMRNNSKKLITKQKASIIEFIYKYFDILLILLYKQNQTRFFDYMTNKENLLFKHYYNHKILTMKNKNNMKDSKETTSFIYYIIEQISPSDKVIKNNNNYKNEMVVNNINECKIKEKSKINNITLKKIKEDIYEYNKLVILCKDDKTKKYYFQDIIDLNELSIYDNKYKLMVNNDIYLIPLKKINSCLYYLKNSTKTLIKESNAENKQFPKLENIPKYSWNIGFDGNNYLLLSEEDNQIYNIIEQKNINKSIKYEYNINKKIQALNINDKKIIGFINGTGNSSSFAHNDKGDIFLLDEQREKYKWLNNKEKERIDFPISIQNVKIINICANYYECYAIGDNGNLYRNYGQNFKKVSLPENTKKFLQCTCGDRYALFLAKNNNNKGVIYTKGSNTNSRLGIAESYSNPFLRSNNQPLIKSQLDENLDFKYISTFKDFSVGLTSDGKLYIWGLYKNLLIEKPILVNKDRNESIIIDKICLNYDQLYAIGRKLEKGNYISKLFILDKIDYFSLALGNPFFLKEINLINKDDNNSRIIPLKILIGENKTYFLCVDENILIDEIIESNKEKNINNKITLSVEYDANANEPKQINYNLEKMQEIYNSDYIDKFIDLFDSLSDKNLKTLIKIFSHLKNDNINILDLAYDEIIIYLNERIEINEYNDLLKFFSTNENNKSRALFTYLKIRIDLIEKNMMNYMQLNNSLKSEGLFQKIIQQNINYLNDDLRLQYFYSLLYNTRDMNLNQYDNLMINHGHMYEITIDRFKANNFKDKYNETKIPDIQLNETVFGQLFQIFKDINGKEFFKDKGQRLFRVNLGAEGGQDAGGPYREILSDICNDLQSDYIELFIKTPNNKNDIGELRDKYIINPDCDNINHKKAFEFIGKLMGLSISSEDALNFNLHPLIWKSLLENKITFNDYKTIDLNLFNLIEKLEEGLSKKDKDLIDIYGLNFVIKNSNGKDIELIKNGQDIKVTLENVGKYIELVKIMKLEEMKNQIKCIKDGLYSVIGKNILQILNWNQIEEMVCGKAEFNLEDFIKHTKCNNAEKVIQWFWEWLKNCKDEDKFKYLKFVTGRSRLPKSNYTHSISIVNFKERNQLPIAHTCSSSLDLPNYESKNILFEKMQYAIESIGNITDN